MSDKKDYLFTLTITPVQSFISQARKTKDLFAGSAILSNLMKEVLGSKDLSSHNVEFIFPYIPNNKIDEVKTSFPNKMVIKIKNITEEQIRAIGKNLEQGVNNQFINTIFKNTKQCDSNFQNFFQVFWVAVELKNDYKVAYKKLEQNLGAVKNLRNFKQETQLKGFQKCSICGERNIADIKENEDKLCLICYTKRSCNKDEDKSLFPSTAKIALLDWLKGVDYENLKQLNNFDEQWFLENDKQEIKNFIKENRLDVSKQKKYYALIKFDVDDMGKKLSSLDENEQKELSACLVSFAKKAKDIVDKSGKTIYAGGDDFLGFVNLRYLFTTIKCIKRAFVQKVNKNFPDLTFSTSIVIAHYKAPLHKVLDFSRELLDKTKKHFADKNGVGIIVMSSNAINAQTICRYDDLNLLEQMKEAKVGMNLHYKLNKTFNFFDNKFMDSLEYEYKIKMLEYEIKRLLKREDTKFNESLYIKLIKLLHKQVYNLDTRDNITIDFINFIGYLKTLEQLKKVS